MRTPVLLPADQTFYDVPDALIGIPHGKGCRILCHALQPGTVVVEGFDPGDHIFIRDIFLLDDLRRTCLAEHHRIVILMVARHHRGRDQDGGLAECFQLC